MPPLVRQGNGLDELTIDQPANPVMRTHQDIWSRNRINEVLLKFRFN